MFHWGALFHVEWGFFFLWWATPCLDRWTTPSFLGSLEGCSSSCLDVRTLLLIEASLGVFLELNEAVWGKDWFDIAWILLFFESPKKILKPVAVHVDGVPWARLEAQAVQDGRIISLIPKKASFGSSPIWNPVDDHGGMSQHQRDQLWFWISIIAAFESSSRNVAGNVSADVNFAEGEGTKDPQFWWCSSKGYFSVKSLCHQLNLKPFHLPVSLFVKNSYISEDFDICLGSLFVRIEYIVIHGQTSSPPKNY